MNTGDRLQQALDTLDRTDPLTEQERAEHAALVHRQLWRDQHKADRQADAFDDRRGDGR